jgi:hypothetical protein
MILIQKDVFVFEIALIYEVYQGSISPNKNRRLISPTKIKAKMRSKFTNLCAVCQMPIPDQIAICLKIVEFFD